jgi:hypothetical protein
MDRKRQLDPDAEHFITAVLVVLAIIGSAVIVALVVFA